MIATSDSSMQIKDKPAIHHHIQPPTELKQKLHLLQRKYTRSWRWYYMEKSAPLNFHAKWGNRQN